MYALQTWVEMEEEEDEGENQQILKMNAIKVVLCWNTAEISTIPLANAPLPKWQLFQKQGSFLLAAMPHSLQVKIETMWTNERYCEKCQDYKESYVYTLFLAVSIVYRCLLMFLAASCTWNQRCWLSPLLGYGLHLGASGEEGKPWHNLICLSAKDSYRTLVIHIWAWHTTCFNREMWRHESHLSASGSKKGFLQGGTRRWLGTRAGCHYIMTLKKLDSRNTLEIFWK